MEPAKAKMKISTTSKVIRVEKRYRKLYVSGFGENTVFHEQDLGWWMILTGSHEAIFIGTEQPNLREDDTVKITFEKQEPTHVNITQGS